MTTLLLSGALATLSGCAEPELGAWCSLDTATVNDLVAQVPGQNTLTSAPQFDGCEKQPFCASTDGSRPYCTQRCGNASECQGLPGETWTCERVVRYGRNACSDWNEQTDCQNTEAPYQYCKAAPAIIEARDEQYGRSWPQPDAGNPDPDPEPDPDAGTSPDGG